MGKDACDLAFLGYHPFYIGGIIRTAIA
jgi:hypothetical protein